MADSSINMPSGFGGLTRFSEEHETKFPLTPTHVIVFIVLIVGFRVAISLFM